MKIYLSESLNPHFNIATEEYLFKNKTDNFFLLYRNSPSVIIGKHQNAFAETNQAEVFINNIPVIRRLSGGGTVYHDEGNINFSFIVNKQKGSLVDFKKHMQPIYSMLKELNLPVGFSKRNDLFIDGKKISGNAEHIFKNRILHHGTILFSSNLKHLSNILKKSSGNYKSKAIQSVKSKVDNIQKYLTIDINIEKFTLLIAENVKKQYKHTESFRLSNEDRADISELVENKYSSWEWNYAYSPDFEFTKTVILDDYSFSSHLYIKKGIIVNAEFTSNYIPDERLKTLSHLLQGNKYVPSIINAVFMNWKINEPEEFVNAIY